MTSLEHGSGAISPDEADALARDAADPLTALRDRFLLPTAPDGSHGDLPRGPVARAPAADGPRRPSSAELDAWASLGVDAWFEPGRPWFTLDQALREPMARVVGALPTEVALLNSLTVEHPSPAGLVLPAGRPTTPDPDRRPALPVRSPRADDATWRCAASTRTRDLVVVGPRAGEATVRTEDLEAAIAEHGRRPRARLPGRRQLRHRPGATRSSG